MIACKGVIDTGSSVIFAVRKSAGLPCEKLMIVPKYK